MAAQADSLATYMQLGSLLASMPNLLVVDSRGRTDDAILTWLAEVQAAIDNLGPAAGTASMEFKVAASMLLQTPNTRGVYASKLKLIAMTSLAKARDLVPGAARGAFIPTGANFDALSAISDVLKSAKSTIMIVDPYLDETALKTFAVFANQDVAIDLLSDEAGMRPALAPSAQAWKVQYGSARPLQVRSAPKRTLHDRALIVDCREAWILTQSLKDFAGRSPATIQRVDTELATMKIEAYLNIWNTSSIVA